MSDAAASRSDTDPGDAQHVRSLRELLDGAPADPRPTWPAVPASPTHPGAGWTERRTEGTGYLVWTQPVPPAVDRGALWLAHRERYEQTGLWPVLVDDRFWESVEFEAGDPSSVTDARAMLRSLVEEYFDDRDVEHGPAPEPSTDDRAPATVIADSDEFSTLLLVPTRAGWAVPQQLNWEGAVNYAMAGREHTAALGRWAALYGAELYGLNASVVMLLVDRPPSEPGARLQAAAEMCAYCPDAVDQGAGTLEALTAMAGSRGWWFWWD